MAKLLNINPYTPEERKLDEAVKVLKKGGVIIFPTDTVYVMGCSIHERKGIEKICQIKGVKLEKSLFTFICQNLSDAAKYAKQIPNPVFKVMKRVFPGPFTFILNASAEVPRILQYKRKTIGLRITSHQIPALLVEKLGHPMISSSLPERELEIEYSTDPSLMEEEYGKIVDIVIDGGIGDIGETTVVDCTEGEIEVIRDGIGEL